jgi:SSS family solute:Na+ symporter
VVIGLYTRWFHRYALFLGWAVAMVYGTIAAYRNSSSVQSHFASSSTALFGHITYIAIVALALNVAVSAVFTVIFRLIGIQDGYDETKPSDYTADPEPDPAGHARARGKDSLAAR